MDEARDRACDIICAIVKRTGSRGCGERRIELEYNKQKSATDQPLQKLIEHFRCYSVHTFIQKYMPTDLNPVYPDNTDSSGDVIFYDKTIEQINPNQVPVAVNKEAAVTNMSEVDVNLPNRIGDYGDDSSEAESEEDAPNQPPTKVEWDSISLPPIGPLPSLMFMRPDDRKKIICTLKRANKPLSCTEMMHKYNELFGTNFAPVALYKMKAKDLFMCLPELKYDKTADKLMLNPNSDLFSGVTSIPVDAGDGEDARPMTSRDVVPLPPNRNLPTRTDLQRFAKSQRSAMPTAQRAPPTHGAPTQTRGATASANEPMNHQRHPKRATVRFAAPQPPMQPPPIVEDYQNYARASTSNQHSQITRNAVEVSNFIDNAKAILNGKPYGLAYLQLEAFYNKRFGPIPYKALKQRRITAIVEKYLYDAVKIGCETMPNGRLVPMVYPMFAAPRPVGGRFHAQHTDDGLQQQHQQQRRPVAAVEEDVKHALVRVKSLLDSYYPTDIKVVDIQSYLERQGERPLPRSIQNTDQLSAILKVKTHMFEYRSVGGSMKVRSHNQTFVPPWLIDSELLAGRDFRGNNLVVFDSQVPPQNQNRRIPATVIPKNFIMSFELPQCVQYRLETGTLGTLPESERYVQVRVSEFYNPGLFFVQSLSMTRCLDDLHSQMRRFYQSGQSNSYAISEQYDDLVGLLVAAEFKHGVGDFQRALIIKKYRDLDSGEAFVTLIYVDFGTLLDNVPISRLRFLKRDFMELNAQAILVALDGFELHQDREIAAEASRDLYKRCSCKTLNALFNSYDRQSGKCFVRLFHEASELGVNFDRVVNALPVGRAQVANYAEAMPNSNQSDPEIIYSNSTNGGEFNGNGSDISRHGSSTTSIQCDVTSPDSLYLKLDKALFTNAMTSLQLIDCFKTASKNHAECLIRALTCEESETDRRKMSELEENLKIIKALIIKYKIKCDFGIN